MKMTHKLALAMVATLFVGTGSLWADDGHRDYRGHDGYWDRDHHYHEYAYWQHHRGYWDYRGPVRVFINVD